MIYCRKLRDPFLCGAEGSGVAVFVTHEADEEALEYNHKLECFGDIVWQTQVEIQCCPYCGERLNSGLKKMNAVYHHHLYG